MLHLEWIELPVVLTPDAGHRVVARLTHIEPAGYQTAQRGEEVGADTEHEQGDDAWCEQARHQAILE